MSPAVTSAELLARLDEAFERTGELDWAIVSPDFEVYDHELPDSAAHRGHEGWRRWVSDWREAFEDYSLESLKVIEVDEARILRVHRLRARGRTSGVELERTDAMLWTFSGERLVRMDYYPNYRSSAMRFKAPGAR
jgi:ketosteroid isomerase-like protein